MKKLFMQNVPCKQFQSMIVLLYRIKERYRIWIS